MNQILVTKKLYITPELRRKKKIYKFDFVLSIFLVVVLFSLYIYAAYDRNKSEAVSQELLSQIDFNVTESNDTTTINKDDNDVLIVYLDGEEDATQPAEEVEIQTAFSQEVYTAANGEQYTIIAKISIPKINLNYPILSQTSDALLKISPCKFWGSKPNEVGNFCVVGHNYRNQKFFSKVPNLEVGDIIEITDMSGRIIQYEVYDKHTVDPKDVSDTTQVTNGRKEVTLITCTDDSKLRWVIRTKEVK